MNVLGNKNLIRPILDVIDYDFAQVSLKLLKKHNINPNQYFFLFYASQNAKDKIVDLLGEDFIKVIRANDLIAKGYLTGHLNDNGVPILTLKFESEFLIRGINAFRELVNTFPIKTPRGDRYYRKNANQVQAYYMKLISKNKALHNHIIACLKFEIQQKEINNKLEYLSGIDQWVLGHQWEAISPDLLANYDENRAPTIGGNYVTNVIED